jgi:signal transduction histidine kinase
VAYATPDGELLYANRHFAEVLGRSPDKEISGSNLMRFVAAGDWTALKMALEQGAVRAVEGEMKVLARDLKTAPRTIRLSFMPLADGKGEATRIVAREVTELVEATRALKLSEASVHSLSARLLQIQDEERRRMARDLHDVTGQELAAAVISLDRLERTIGRPGVDVKQAIAESTAWLRKVETEIRTLSYVLHPPLLDEMGLASALNWFVQGFSKRTGIDVETDIADGIPRLQVEREMAIFRVVQECLANVFRHSGSRRARVRLTMNGEWLEASVADEGKGFEHQDASGAVRPGVGIQSMRGRLEPVGGSLQLQSSRRGAKVTARVPLQGCGGVPGEIFQFSVEAGSPAPHPPNARKRVLIADDHEVARQGIRMLLKDQADMEICGEAENGIDAVVKTGELMPDLLILDLSMPHLGGFSAANRIRAAGINTKILIYTTHAYPGLEHTARASGVDGFVLKSKASEDLIRGARAVLEGREFYTSP